MKATNKEYYWAKYIRNKKSIWIGENTESLILNKLILNKLNILKKQWIVVINNTELVECHKNLNIEKNHVFSPEAQDIIPFILLKIKEKNLFCYTDNNINYLYNFV